ncbi:hypothetical protein HV824_19745 [Myxococcus sp. AM009]|uniref:hypothetical protein n=1 Tax=unclassified Myxococcus TaxID=2648731 RepID=UPI001594ED95|nr:MULTISPECIES: hypothetical protein [unclassified Myxococcus]NVJ00343.1 hypothetical protein [Myxococcus sp. AM009]NVJ12778.1 hypothetical protein [Myxococcus sp. AM010]
MRGSRWLMGKGRSSQREAMLGVPVLGLQAMACLREGFAVALEVTGVWDDRRYLDMSLLNSTPDTAAA